MTLADIAALERARERGWVRDSVVMRARAEYEPQRQERAEKVRKFREAVAKLMGESE